MKILIVDDNRDDREVLRIVIKRHGHEVIEAGDGLEGLRMAKLHAPDLIISDALMPVMDGFQFLRQIKQDELLRSIPFLFYSATYRADKDVDLAIALGAEAYILKPKEPSELWEEVELILQNMKKEKTITPELIEEDEEYLRRYREVVATKLEEKIRELEDTKSRLEESEAFVRNILETVDEGFIVIDRQYRILSANKAFCSSANLTEGQVLGRLCYEASHHCNKPCFETGEECAVKHTFETGAAHAVSHIHVRENGTKYHVEVKSYPITDASGNVMSAIETITDVTEKIKLEDQLRHAQKMEAVGTLAGGIAHDFNNILNVIIGYGTMVIDKLEVGSPSKEQMNEVLTAAERAANLTKRLLVFSRKQVVEVKPVNINELILGLQKILIRLIRESIEFNLDLADRPLMVLADAGQIEQVLMNLAANARDAMTEGGRLTIGTGIQELDDEYVAAYGYGKPGKYALITVTDTGHGIDVETQKKIFEPFFTTKGIGEGTGLGLSISYGIIEQHNGYIKVYSEPGQGAVFKIYLPLIEETVSLEKKIETPDAVKGGNETILVAEDDASVMNLTRIVLESFGYSVITAEDGEDAITKFMENRGSINLVILDMIMPKKSGKDAYEEIRKASPSIKTLFMSGYMMDIIKTKELTEAGFDFLLKPFVPKDLLKKVREKLDR